jgi:hypothetical protein
MLVATASITSVWPREGSTVVFQARVKPFLDHFHPYVSQQRQRNPVIQRADQNSEAATHQTARNPKNSCCILDNFCYNLNGASSHSPQEVFS